MMCRGYKVEGGGLRQFQKGSKEGKRQGALKGHGVRREEKKKSI